MGKRYHHILVPLDGSELAELALPDALYLAQLSQAEVTLLQVLPSIGRMVTSSSDRSLVVDEQWETRKAVALEYLKRITGGPEFETLSVHIAVEVGSGPEIIIDYAHSNPIDLIVMATHGRSGIQRWVYGSVADKVLRGAKLPVLLVRSYN